MKKKLLIGGLILMIAATAVVGFLIYSILNHNNQMNVDSLDNEMYVSFSSPENMKVDEETKTHYVNNELLIYTQGRADVQMKELLNILEGQIAGYISEADMYQIRLDIEMDYPALKRLAEALEQETFIEAVFCNYVLQTEEKGGNEEELWPYWGTEAIRAEEAWEYRDQMDIVRVGIIDNYFLTDHDALSFVEEPLFQNEVKSEAVSSHGTHVAGIIGGVWGAQNEIKGIAPNSQLYGVAYEGAREAGYTTMAVWNYGLTYLIVREKCQVINVSVGSDIRLVAASWGDENARKETDEINAVLENHLNLFLDGGYEFVICMAAGNENDKNYIKVDVTEDAPYGLEEFDEKKHGTLEEVGENLVSGNTYAEYDRFSGIKNERLRNRIIVVGSIGYDGESYYVDPASNVGKRVDVLAPGEKIYSSGIDGGMTDFYVYGSGTSMAAPHISGIAAMLFGLNGELTGEQVRDIIRKTAVGEYEVVTSEEKFTYYLADAYRAVITTAEGTAIELDSDEEETEGASEETTAETYENLEQLPEGLKNELEAELLRFMAAPSGAQEHNLNEIVPLIIGNYDVYSRCRFYLDYFGGEGITWYSNSDSYEWLEGAEEFLPYEQSKADPKNWFAEHHYDSAIYAVFDADNVDWLLKNIFNIEPEHTEEFRYYDGNYYGYWIASGGENPDEIRIESLEPAGTDTYYVQAAYSYSFAPDYGEFPYYFMMKRSNIDELEKEIWTYVNWSQEPLKEAEKELNGDFLDPISINWKTGEPYTVDLDGDGIEDQFQVITEKDSDICVIDSSMYGTGRYNFKEPYYTGVGELIGIDIGNGFYTLGIFMNTGSTGMSTIDGMILAGSDKGWELVTDTLLSDIEPYTFWGTYIDETIVEITGAMNFKQEIKTDVKRPSGEEVFAWGWVHSCQPELKQDGLGYVFSFDKTLYTGEGLEKEGITTGYVQASVDIEKKELIVERLYIK